MSPAFTRHTERGRFPRGRAEIPDAAIAYLAQQIDVERTEIAFYDFTGRRLVLGLAADRLVRFRVDWTR
ncbi:hypothetical protein [Nocardia gipuzkoensis]